MRNDNRPPGAEDAGTGANESHQPDSTSIPRWVKRKPTRITKAVRDAISLLYSPPKLHDQDDDEVSRSEPDGRPTSGIENERIGFNDA